MELNFKRMVLGTLEDTVTRVAEALKKEGFGVLTRIDLHAKIKEKIGRDVAPTVILGACNPALAFEAYQANSDVASLLPCNAVVRAVGGDRMSVELVRPTAMMEMLGDEKLVEMAGEADQRLKRALDSL